MSAEPPVTSSTAPHVLLIAKVGVSIGLLWLLFSRIDVSTLWKSARQASLPWMLVALAVYAVNVLASTWRWQLLLDAQGVQVRNRFLLGSLLVALFFNNFLPSNIGGDVIRIRDTARPAGSKTLATAVVLMDRVLGLMGLVLVAAFSATVTGASHRPGMQMWPIVAVGRVSGRRRRVGAGAAGTGGIWTAAAAADGISSPVGRRAHRYGDLRPVAVSRSAGRAGRLLRRRRPRPGVDGGVLLLRRLRLAPAPDVLGSRGDRARSRSSSRCCRSR